MISRSSTKKQLLFPGLSYFSFPISISFFHFVPSSLFVIIKEKKEKGKEEGPQALKSSNSSKRSISLQQFQSASGFLGITLNFQQCFQLSNNCQIFSSRAGKHMGIGLQG